MNRTSKTYIQQYFKHQMDETPGAIDIKTATPGLNKSICYFTIDESPVL